MLEGLIIIFFGKHVVGRIADRKGYSEGLFTALFAILWFGGEIFGFLFGMSAAAGSDLGLGPAYLSALLFAAAGAFIVFVVALALPTRGLGDDEEKFDRFGQPRKKKAKRKARRPRYEDDEDDEEETPRPRSRTRSRRRDDDDDGITPPGRGIRFGP